VIKRLEKEEAEEEEVGQADPWEYKWCGYCCYQKREMHAATNKAPEAIAAGGAGREEECVPALGEDEGVAVDFTVIITFWPREAQWVEMLQMK
jgi:hypothetical protein